MRILKTMYISLLIGSYFAVSVFAVEPVEVKKSEVDKQQIVEKIYVLPITDDGSTIPTDNFTEDDIEYAFSELVKADNSKEEFKEHTEEVSFPVKTDNTETVISLFVPTIDISTEDGFSGTLYLDYSTLKVESAGYGTQSYKVSESRSYPNLHSADTALVPKTINKDGSTLNLTDISWQSAASDNIDGQDLAVRYTAHATYSGTGTKKYTKGYTATAQYKGEVKKVTNDTVLYTAVFKEVPKKHIFDYAGVGLLGLTIVLAVSGGTYVILRRRRNHR